MTSLQTEELPMPGGVMRYDRREGVAPALVLLPGWSCPRSDWYAVAGDLEPLQLAIADLPGQGESSGSGGSIADLGAAVAALIDHLGWPDVVLAGHSMGAAVAVEAAAVSQRVSRIIGLDSLTYQTLYPRQDEADIQAVLAPLAGDFQAGMTALVTGLFADQSSARIPEIADSMAAMPQSAALASLRALMEWDRDAALAACGVPVDVIATAEFLDPGAVERLPRGVRVHAAELGGHFFLIDRPAQTAQLIHDLLDG